MANNVELLGVRTWYDDYGEGEAVVLLHPGAAGVDARAWRPNLEALTAEFRVFTPERRTWSAVVTGRSFGLLVALHRPDLVRKLAFIAGVFHYEGWAPRVLDATPNPPEFLERFYAEFSPDGPGHYPVIVKRLAKMPATEPALTPSELNQVEARTLVIVGDDDDVPLEHAIALYRNLPNGELAVIPGASHGLLVERPAVGNSLILDFLTTDPVPTPAPIRRAEPKTRL